MADNDTVILETSGGGGGGAMSLRERIANERGPVEAPESSVPSEPSAEPAGPPNGKSMSLREALSRQAAPAAETAAAADPAAPAPAEGAAPAEDAAPAGPAAAADPVAVAEPVAGDPTAEASDQPTAKAVSLREALSRQTLPMAPVAAQPEPAPEPAVGEAVVSQPVPESSDQPRGKAVSLRDALAGQTIQVEPKAAAGDPPPPLVSESVVSEPVADPSSQPNGKSITLREALSRTAAAPPPAAPEPDSRPAAAPYTAVEPPALRAVSLRDALAGTGETVAPPAATAPRPGGYVSNVGDTAPMPVGDAIRPTDIKPTQSEKVGREQRRRLSVPVPDVKTPPSTKILAIAGAALAAVVIIALVAVALTRGRSSHHVPALGTVESSVDACNVVTAAQASAAFGHSAGPAQLVLGECVYDDGARELIVEVARENARSQFASSRTASAVDVPKIGDGAYYANGHLWVLKGSSLLQLTLGPVPAATLNPILVTVATSAVGRLEA